MLIQLAIIIVFNFYYWIVNNSVEPYWQAFPEGWYNVLTNALMHGQLHFLVEPRPELLSLSDPYDPAQNGPYRLHDMSLYKGKYYLYFGVVPAIVFFLPYRLITGQYLSEPTFILLASFGGFIFGLLILLHVQKNYFSKLPNWIIAISILMLGFANFVPAYLRRLMMYEVAISGAFFFSSGGLFFLIKAFSKERINIAYVVMGSLFLGLASGCRHQMALSGGLILLLLFVFYIKNKRSIEGNKIVTALILPFVICLLLLALYNYLRFGNPFDCGHAWQLNIVHLKKFKFFGLEFLKPGLYLYLFQPPAFDTLLPYIHIRTVLLDSLQPNSPYFVEISSGLIPCIPFIGFVLCCILSLPKIRKRFYSEVTFPLKEVCVILLYSILNLCVLISLSGATLRYFIDFAPGILLTSIICWFYFISSKNKKMKNMIFAMGIMFIIISIIFGIAFGTEKYFERLRAENLIEYARIDNYFKTNILKIRLR